MFDIVCYLGGTAGDLVTAMIDPGHAVLSNGAVMMNHERLRLKKSWQFATDHDRNCYVDAMKQHYKSIPSHDADYHIRANQPFIAMVVSDRPTAKWAAQRFKNLHSAQVWQRMQNVNNAETVDSYAQDMLDWSSWIKSYTNRTVNLEDVLDGRACEAVSAIISIDPVGETLYQQWLNFQNENSNNNNPRRSQHQN